MLNLKLISFILGLNQLWSFDSYSSDSNYNSREDSDQSAISDGAHCSLLQYQIPLATVTFINGYVIHS